MIKSQNTLAPFFYPLSTDFHSTIHFLSPDHLTPFAIFSCKPISNNTGQHVPDNSGILVNFIWWIQFCYQNFVIMYSFINIKILFFFFLNFQRWKLYCFPNNITTVLIWSTCCLFIWGNNNESTIPNHPVSININ